MEDISTLIVIVIVSDIELREEEGRGGGVVARHVTVHLLTLQHHGVGVQGGPSVRNLTILGSNIVMNLYEAFIFIINLFNPDFLSPLIVDLMKMIISSNVF